MTVSLYVLSNAHQYGGWGTLQMWASIAVGIPLAVLILGASLVWVLLW